MFFLLDVSAWAAVRTPSGLAAALALELAASTFVAATVSATLSAARWSGRKLGPRASAARLLATAAFAGLITAHALAAPLAARPTVSRIGIAIGVYLGALAAATVIARIGAARAYGERASHGSIVLSVVVGAGALAVDKTWLTSLYARAHDALELVARIALTLAFSIVFHKIHRIRRPFVLALAGWVVALVAIEPVRRAVERGLPSVWEEPVHAARWLRRARDVSTFLGPGRGNPDALGVARLFHEYELRGALLHPRWSAEHPPPATPASTETNVVVFFVDALRADVAKDPAVMPNVTAWMDRNTSFSRAYGVGSSTILSLVPLLGCRYDRTATDEPTLLAAARATGRETALFIPRAAAEFHHEYFPAFRFDHEDVTDDYVGKRVPTAEALVDRTLAWLAERRDRKSFVWTYNYDVHSWGDIDEGYVKEIASEGGLSDEDGLALRYRAAARGVDLAFGKLLDGLVRLGIDDRTVVVFVSDHGEALGEKKFWIHSTYLWESLLRVPLGIGAPGQAPRKVETPVSLVDLGPMLAPFVPFPTGSCHGHDALEAGAPRPDPILFSAVSDGRLARVGLLDENERKLVVDVLAGEAKLFRVGKEHAAEDDVSDEEPGTLLRRLDELVTAPLFPR